MKRQLEDWELDRIAEGDADPALRRRLDASPEDQRRMNEIRAEEQPLRRALFRAACPPSLSLGEWNAGMLAASVAQEIAGHVASCVHCTADVARIEAAMNAPVTLAKEPVLRRIVLKLESLFDAATGAPAAVALRGDSWSGLFANGDYMISLTKRRASGGYSLQGSLITPEPSVKGEARLVVKEGAVLAGTPLSAAATFVFDGVPSGQYELVVRTAASELIVPGLQFQE
jgi:hypothetical protein